MKNFFNPIFYLLGELFPGLPDLLAEVLGDVEVVFLEDGRSAQRGILVSRIPPELLGDPEATANPYCNYAYLYWEGCVICVIYLW